MSTVEDGLRDAATLFAGKSDEEIKKSLAKIADTPKPYYKGLAEGAKKALKKKSDKD